ncbi:MAG: DUF1801 domain-containing protein [Planctomycetota bacterium]
MDGLFRFPEAVSRSPDVDSWFAERDDELGTLARRWFDELRSLGEDVRECMHDGQPTACVQDTAFAYVAAYKAHVNVGFSRGAELPDPAELLARTGKRMLHVKLRPGESIDEGGLTALLQFAYQDMQRRVAAGS